MRADVRDVPVVLVGKKNNARLVLPQNFRDHLHRARPVRGTIFSGRKVDLFQSVRRGLNELEADALAAALQFRQTFGLAFALAAERDGDVADAPAGFAQQAQREAADDDLVVGMGRKDQHGGSVGREVGTGATREAAEWELLSLAVEAGVFGDELRIWIHGSSRAGFTQSDLFANAKLAEDRVEQILRRSFSDDFTDGVDGDAQFHRGEFEREVFT